MSLRKTLPRLGLTVLALCAAVVSPLLGEEEPYLGLWETAGTGALEGDLFLYRLAMRFNSRAALRSTGILPEPFRASEDSLGLRSDRFEDFVLLQDSLGMGWLPPAWGRLKGGKDFTSKQVSIDLDSLVVEEGLLLEGDPILPAVRREMGGYLEELTRRNYRSLWAEKAVEGLQTIEDRSGQKAGLVPKLALPVEMPGPVRSIIGAGRPSLTVRGSERISFSGTSRWYPDRPINEFQRKASKFPQLDMKQELNLTLTGNIGDKVSVDVDQSSQAATPLENRIKIRYKGYEDEIIQQVDLGNTSLQLPSTQYVSYQGRHEGLFGINTRALVGSVEVTGILSKQEGKNDTRSLTRGAEVRTFEIEDWQYRRGKFFFLIDPDGPRLPEGDQVVDLEVWIDDRNGSNNNEQLTVPAYVTLSGNPPGRGEGRDSVWATGAFNRLTPSQDFIVQMDVYPGYPVLILDDYQILDDRMTKAMGVSYRTLSGLEVGGTTGGNPDSLVLMILRPAAEMGETNPLDLTQGIFADKRRWEMRNVYDLGSNLSSDGLTVRVRRKRTVGGITNPDRIGEVTFLEILGLDLYTDAGENQTPGPDGKIDRGKINYDSGYVMLCNLQPFAPVDVQAALGCEPTRAELPDDHLVPGLYLRNDWSSGVDANTISQFQFEVTARTSVSRISLNAFNILQGSEVVTAGGRTLARDRDYTIDYDAGEIQILDAADVRDTDEIRVSYSYLPFGGGGQKTLIGTALRYRPQAAKLDLSTAWVYESKGAPGIEGRRPRLGQEPTRTVVGEVAASYKAEPWLLTALADGLPFVRASARSAISLDTGTGLSFPNPNTRGLLYVDDFEGAKDVFSISTNRVSWRPAGVPEAAAKGAGAVETCEYRGEAWWYTPRAAVKEGDLQPTHEGSGGLDKTEKDNNRQVLEIHFIPAGSQEQDRRKSWFSLVQPIAQRGTDLSRAQFLDIWVNDFRRPGDAVSPREGKLHIDIGVVSEDAVWTRRRVGTEGLLELGSFPDAQLGFREFDTEDSTRDGQLDDPGGGGGEDIGIDFKTDPEEGAGEDPAYDNWDFDEGEDDSNRDLPFANPNDLPAGRYLLSEERFAKFARINGTQANGRLDTEDLNGNQILDQTEAYFAFELDLADPSLIEFESSQAPDQDQAYSGYTRGWRRIRIPLAPQFYTKVGNPSWEQVRHVRIWLDGFSKQTVLQVGGIDITGNRWLKGAIRDARGAEVSAEELEQRGEDFFPAVLNNKDNSTSEYTPPFKPKERQNVEEREQSLALELRNFPPGHRSSVYRTFPQAQDFVSLYRTLEFYLNRRIREGPPDPNLEFFVRLSRNAATEEENYYEYRVPVPRDWVLHTVSMGELSRLQLERADSATGIVVERLENGATLTRKGSPSFTSIQRISFGVINVGVTTVENGSVWVDELRLGSVKRDTGMANRVSFNMAMSDLASANVSFQRMDADFLRVGSERGSGTTRTDYTVGGRLNAEKFAERSGLRLPLSFNVSRGRTVPKFRTNGDLVLEKPRPSDITESINKDFSFSLSRNRSTNPWLRYTLDAVSLSGRTGQSIQNSPDARDTTVSSSGNLQFSLPLQGGPPIKYYKDKELRLLPNSLTLGLSGSRQRSISYRRKNADLTQDLYEPSLDLRTRTASMSWSTGLRPVEQVTYGFDQTRDLLLATAPRRVGGVNLGTETGRRHQLNASHQISLFKRALVPKVTWAGNSDNKFNAIQASGGVRERSNNFDTGNTLTFTGTLPIDRLFQMLPRFGRGGGAAPAPGDSAAGASRGRSAGRATSSGSSGGWFSISAVSATHSIGKTRSLDRFAGEPSIPFQLGLSSDPGSGVRRLTGASDATGDRKDTSFSTDFKLLGEVTVRTSYAQSRSDNTVNRTSSTIRTWKYPDLDINWGRFYKRVKLDRWAKDVRATTRYSRELRETGTSTNPKDRTESTVSFRPLLNLDATLNNGFSAKLTSSYSTSNSEQFGLLRNLSRSRSRQAGLSLRRSFNLSRMVTNPITKKKTKATTKIDLSLATDIQDSKRESGPRGRLIVIEDRAKMAISTTAGYNFTSNITGNAGLTVGQDSDRKNRTNTSRYVSVTLSAAFTF
ncbi:MAG: cell surface protein SprA [Candidatus Eisenbacteria bacterium]|nr:cell surface protein SprA [Candidatus Eisenbacteria bacterium]